MGQEKKRAQCRYLGMKYEELRESNQDGEGMLK